MPTPRRAAPRGLDHVPGSSNERLSRITRQEQIGEHSRGQYSMVDQPGGGQAPERKSGRRSTRRTGMVKGISRPVVPHAAHNTN